MSKRPETIVVVFLDPSVKWIRPIVTITAVRLKVEENQLVGVFGEIGVVVDGLKGA